MLRQNPDYAVLTIFDRLLYLARDKINPTVSSGMSGSGSLHSGRLGGGNTVVSTFLGGNPLFTLRRAHGGHAFFAFWVNIGEGGLPLSARRSRPQPAAPSY
jgi:hypothetical protein